MPIMSDAPMREPGPFKADQLDDGDPYELVDGHAYHVLPASFRHGRANLYGALAIGSDPAVKAAAVDAGWSPSSGNLHAPDISVGDAPDEPGWVAGKVPALAVEYADRGQDEPALRAKIASLLEHGTRFVWVVRLKRRDVEVHVRGARVRIARRGELLEAPGVLANAIPVEALFDRDAALEATRRNLLGADIPLRDKEAEALALAKRALESLLEARQIVLDPASRARIEACDDARELGAWLGRAATARTLADVLSE